MSVRTRTALSVSAAATAVVLTVAACSSSGGGTGATTPAATVTATQTVSSAAPPTGSGVPVSTPAASGGGGGSTSSAGGPVVCTPTVMRFSVGRMNGAAGTIYFQVTATNGSSAPCVTTGFPGVAFLDGTGGQVLQAQRVDTVQKTQLTVQPGQSVTTTIGAAQVGSGNGGCPASAAILFTLPDNTDSTKLTVPTAQVCSATVEALVSGTGSG